MGDNIQATPTFDDPPGGTLVEMTEILLAHTAGRIRAYKTLGRRPAGTVTGDDYFGVSIGEGARVIRLECDAVQVQILGGPWRGREGWTSREGFRIPPTAAESSARNLDGLSLLERREIYAACHAAGMTAVSVADAHYPFDRIPSESEAAQAYLRHREKLYTDTRASARREVAQRYGIEAERLVAIDQEGDREKWPLWDGLFDERGPIPSFGPVRTDERGRVLMNDEERVARRDAAIRALAAIGQITDETDTDERWADFSRV